MQPEELFFEVHKDNPQEGPGSFESTKTAFNLIKDLPAEPVIPDVGCGPGRQTFGLAKISDAKIFAVDFYQQYLDQLNAVIDKNGLDKKITTYQADMNDLPFEPGSFDIIWSEGSIYLMGVEKAIKDWKKLLKEDGYLAFSDICWITNQRPEEIETYWNSMLGKVNEIGDVIDIVLNNGLKLIGTYTLPPNDWSKYYDPLKTKLEDLKVKFKNDQTLLNIVYEEINEIEMFEKYYRYYSYLFFIIQKL